MTLATAIRRHQAGITRAIALRAWMNAGHVTIAALAAHMQVTQRRVRDVRNGVCVSALAEYDYREAVDQVAATQRAARQVAA